MGETAGDYAASLFLKIGITCSLAMGSIGYISGSTPEWVVLKASVGLIGFGIVGWLAAAVLRRKGARIAEDVKDKEQDEDKDKDADIALTESAATDPGANGAATT